MIRARDMGDERKKGLNDELRALRRRNEELEKALAKTQHALSFVAESEKRCRRLFETAKDGIMLIDPVNGNIIDANQAFVDLSGFSRNELLGKKLWEITPFKEIDAGLVAFRELQTKDRIHYDELPFETKGGRRISVEFVCTGHHLDGDKVMQCSIRDVTERRRIEGDLWKLESRFQALFRQAAIGIAIVDLDGYIVENNKHLGEMLGYSEKELQGKRSADFILAEDLIADERLFQELSSGKSDSYQTVKRCVRKDGTLLWGLFTISLIREARDASILILWIVDDITDRKQAEDALALSEARFRQLAENIREVFWVTTPDYSKILYVSPAYEEIWGRTCTSLYENPFSWFEAIHLDDRLRVEKSLNATEEQYEAEFRIIRPDGTIRWIHDRGFPLKDVSGQIYRIVGIAEDITVRKLADEALFQSESTLRTFYESAPMMMGVIELTDEGKLIHIYDNPATARFFSVPYEDTKNKPADALGAPAEAIQEWVARYRQSRQEHRPVRFEYAHRSQAGPLWLSATVSPIGRGPSGRWRFSYVAEDITERKQAEEKIRQANELLKIQATTDVLTGIFNRLKFADFLEQEIREARRYKHPLSLIMFDIDHFKHINDTYGHLAGDEVLREVAKLISEHVRHADIFSRWGGEEFMILAPHSELETTRQLADKLRSIIEQHRYPSCPETVTCSFGVTRFIDADTVETFTNRTDSALYRAKNGGRNRVEVIVEGESDGFDQLGPPPMKISA